MNFAELVVFGLGLFFVICLVGLLKIGMTDALRAFLRERPMPGQPVSIRKALKPGDDVDVLNVIYAGGKKLAIVRNFDGRIRVIEVGCTMDSDEPGNYVYTETCVNGSSTFSLVNKSNTTSTLDNMDESLARDRNVDHL